MMATSWKDLSADSDQHYKSGEFGKAVKGYTQLLRQGTPSSEEQALVYNNRGHAKYMMVDFYKAKEDFDEAIRLNPSLAVAFYNRGTIHYRMGDFNLALMDFQMCTKLEPNNPEFTEGLESCLECTDK